MNAENYIKAQLAEFAVQEGARHGGVANMVAVAQVMKNRVDAGWYGGDWMHVLRRAHERAGTVYSGQEVENLRDGNVRQLLQRIDDIFDGSETDEMTDGALFYCELHQVDREWFRTHVLGGKKDHVATIGPVSFFR